MLQRGLPENLDLKPELCLLLAGGPAGSTEARQAVIHELLSSGIDWTLFARNAVAHGLTNSIAHALADLAADKLPGDILDAFHAIIDEASRNNHALFSELSRLVEALAANGVEVIPLKGPVLAIQSYGGVGRRDVRRLEFLARPSDIAAAVVTLDGLGYEPDQRFDRNQIPRDVIRFGKPGGTPIELRTKLIPPDMALDTDYSRVWCRALRTQVDGQALLMPEPADGLLLLVQSGGGHQWRKLKSLFDLAAFIVSHPTLDWAFAIERAREERYSRMLLLGTALARNYLHAPVPDALAQAELADPVIGVMARRVAGCWQSEEAAQLWSDDSVSMDRLRLHDGLARQVRYLVRSVFLPRPNRAALMPCSPDFGAASIPTNVLRGLLAVPLSHGYGRIRQLFEGLPYAAAGSGLMLALMPASAEIKLSVQRYERARLAAKRALAREPRDAATWRALGDAQFGLRRFRKALACYDKALSLAPQDAASWKRRAASLHAMGGSTDLPAPPSGLPDADQWATHAGRLFALKRFAEAIEASDHALALNPNDLNAARIGITARLCVCDWRRREADERQVAAEIKAGRRILAPFWHRAISDSEADSLTLARLCGSGLLPPPAPLWRGERYRHDKIRIAYCSTDFRDHVVADVMAGCFEHHDKSRFETTAISLGPDDRSATRRRIAAAFDRFIDVQAMSDFAVAKLLRESEIDIIIDLNGYSGDRRTGIFAYRSAPVQVTFQGYPGTMGVPFYDYIIADPVVIPLDQRIHYSEQVVYMPHTYMPHDRTRPIAARTPTRSEAGLPDTGFVFACHNNDYKFGPELFDIWMRLLKAVEGSLLWLKSLNPWAMINLRREASARGVAPERILFAPRLPRTEDHLARLALADIFLDTRPYNAHATACDALWVGVPVVTCSGTTFPSRVAASLLYAIGMPELVAASLPEYEAVALALARDPELLARVKAKLKHNRETKPLFDTARFTRDLEAAYRTMWNRLQEGLPPISFAVDQLPAWAA